MGPAIFRSMEISMQKVQPVHGPGTSTETGPKKDREFYARLWFSALAQFHQVNEPGNWQFTEQHVIDFLRSKLKQGMPSWKRLKIVEGLLWYRNHIRKTSTPRLEVIRATLQKRVHDEKLAQDDLPIEEVAGKINPREPDVIQLLRKTLRLHRKAVNTEKAYVSKVRAFMKERGLKSLADFDGIGAIDVESHLTDLAVDGGVAAPTQAQAFYGLLFLFEHVLKRDFGKIDAIRASSTNRIPTVLSREEVSQVFSQMNGMPVLIAQLLYGCGMRISECLRLRIKDFDFEQGLIAIHCSKGNKSRFAPLPKQLVEPIRKLIESRRQLHERDLASGEASVWLPHALDRKYPNAHREFKWQFLFASSQFSRDPRTGKRHRHHLHRDTFASHLRQAIHAIGICSYIPFLLSAAVLVLSDSGAQRSGARMGDAGRTKVLSMNRFFAKNELAFERLLAVLESGVRAGPRC